MYVFTLRTDILKTFMFKCWTRNWSSL